MRPVSAIVLLTGAVCSSVAAIKTSIYIDQVPGYPRLAPCAKQRVSAIVRAQASGCGDEKQLTSFSCFCIDQSSMMSSIISTAVQEECAASATRAATTPLPDVAQAGKVFDAYCARSTELIWYQNNATSTSPSTITPAPSSLLSPASTSSTFSAAPFPSTKNSVPVAAIAAPVVIGVLAIAGVVGLLFWLRRRRAAKTNAGPASQPLPQFSSVSEAKHGPVEASGQREHWELPGNSVKYRYELETKPVGLGNNRSS